jgi:hypothetical protein
VCLKEVSMSTFSSPVKRSRDDGGYKRVSYGPLPQRILDQNPAIKKAFESSTLWNRQFNARIALSSRTIKVVGPSLEELELDPSCKGVLDVIGREPDLFAVAEAAHNWPGMLRLRLRNVSNTTLVFKTDPQPRKIEHISGHYQFANSWRVRDNHRTLEVSYLQAANANGNAFRVMRDVNHVEIDPGEMFEIDMGMDPNGTQFEGRAWHNRRSDCGYLNFVVDAVYRMPTGTPDSGIITVNRTVITKRVQFDMQIELNKLFYVRNSGHRLSVPDADIKVVVENADGEFDTLAVEPSLEIQNEYIDSDPEDMDDAFLDLLL